MKKKVLVIMVAALMLNVMNVSVYAETNEAIEKSFEDTETIKKVQELLNAQGYSCGEPDGVAGQNTTNAIIQYKTVNGMDATSTITQKLLDSLESSELSVSESNNSMPEGMSVGEQEWKNWKSSSVCTIIPFLESAEKAGFLFSLPSGQKDSGDKVGTFELLDENGNITKDLEQTDFYYGVEKQHILYTGLETRDTSIYESADFKEACIRLILGYNMHLEKDTMEAALNLTRERAEEIVNYCLDNTIKFCVVDNMRIHLTYRNDTADPFYRLHVEY